MHLCLVACSYDTGFEPVAAQLQQKLDELRAIADHFTLILVNDAPDPKKFEDAVRSVDAPEVILHHLDLSSKGKWGMKGLALRAGMTLALEKSPDLLAYINLNLKVDARQLKQGIEGMQSNHWDAAFGSRAQTDAGQRLGAGRMGALKSTVFGAYARAMLPPLDDFRDPNGPAKIFTPPAAGLIVQRAQSEGAFFDCEWLTILAENGLSTGIFPIIWHQRPGSQPPWSLVCQSVLEVWQTRKRWKQGLYRTGSSR